MSGFVNAEASGSRFDDFLIDPELLDETAPLPSARQAGGLAGDEEEEEVGDVESKKFGGIRGLTLGDIAGAAAAEPGEDDFVLNRLAGVISRAGEGQRSMEDPIFQAEVFAADQEDLPQTSTRPRKSGRRIHKPSAEVQLLLGKANMVYITQGPEQAIELFLEVIRHDPQVESAWKSLASMYEETEQYELSRQMKFCGAHLEGDPDTWTHLANEFKMERNHAQSLYCLRKAYKLDPTSSPVLWELLDVYRTDGQRHKAVNVLKRLCRADPTHAKNFDFLEQFQTLLMETNQFDLGVQLFRDAFDYHLETFDGPAPEDDEDDENPDGKDHGRDSENDYHIETDEEKERETEKEKEGQTANTMRVEHVVALADFLLKADELESAVDVIKRGQRWLSGRNEQKYWDEYEDDREYDPPDYVRPYKDAMVPLESYYLDEMLRHRLGLARLRLGDDDEATLHLNEIGKLDPRLNEDLFRQTAEALMTRNLWDRALDYWAALSESLESSEPSVIYNLGKCQHNLKMNSQAEEALKWVVDVEPDNRDARLLLASILEDLGKRAEALDVVNELLGAAIPRKHMSKGEKAADTRLNKHILEAQAQSTMQTLWQELQEAEIGIGEGDPLALDVFIDRAGTMVETFRLAKRNFNKNRGITRVVKRRQYGAKNDVQSQAQAMKDRLHRTLGFEDETPMDQAEKYTVVRQTDFYGIGAEDWLALTIKNEAEVALDILEHVIWSGLFNNKRSEIALRLVIIACAIRIPDYARVTENCKQLSQRHQFRPEPLLIMLALLSGGGYKAVEAWQAVNLQKFLHRELRMYNDASLGYKLKFSSRQGRWTLTPTTGLSRQMGDIDFDYPDANDEVTTRSKKSKSKSKKKFKQIDDVDEEDVGNDDDDEEEEEGEEDDNDEVEADDASDEEALPEDELEALGNRECPKPTSSSPVFNTIYGLNLLSSKGYKVALVYLFRAYELNPYDAFLNLCIAQAYFGRAMVRQSDNRHFQITQGLVFLSRYRALSPKDAVSQEEVEYNFGRAFHSISIVHLAVDHYERVLTSVKARMDETDDLGDAEAIRRSSHAWEAAHNLVLIYASMGSTELVKQKSEWLAI